MSVHTGPGRPRRVVILGSTGSIGTQALDIIRQYPQEFEVIGLSAGSRSQLLAEQAEEFSPEAIGIADHTQRSALEDRLSQDRLSQDRLSHDRPNQNRTAQPRISSGAEAAAELAALDSADIVLNAITGSVGLPATLAALRAGKTLALANKESLVVGGALVKAAQQRPGQILPVDSEHSAIAQALLSGHHRSDSPSDTEVRKLILTASGGPFRSYSAEELAEVTPEQALEHPNFSMGRVVSTNSATMVNKALEVIEAHLLFGIDLDQIEVVVHPQQYIHSMVEFQDGATLAQAGMPRMLVPIAWGLSYPRRLADIDTAIDFTQLMSWDFEPLDTTRFPAVQLAKAAAGTSGWHMAVFNAANETAVDAFHRHELAFPGILEIIAATLEAIAADPRSASFSADSYDQLMAVDSWARETAEELINGRSWTTAWPLSSDGGQVRL